MNFTRQYLAGVGQILLQLDADAIDRVVPLLAETRKRGGRLFILGVGGSAANASHAVNDFRKLAHLEAYAPTDNVSELIARAVAGARSVPESLLLGGRDTPASGLLRLCPPDPLAHRANRCTRPTDTS